MYIVDGVIMGGTLIQVGVVATTQQIGNLTLRLWRDVEQMGLVTTKCNPNDFQKVPPLGVIYS